VDIYAVYKLTVNDVVKMSSVDFNVGTYNKYIFITRKISYRDLEFCNKILVISRHSDRRRDMIVDRGKKFLCIHSTQTGCEAHSASYPMGTRAVFLRLKRPRREADHSPQPSA
jgi:hypothetical protein